MLPDVVREGVEATLGAVGRVEAVGGGCVSHASRVEAGGSPVFLKYERNPPENFFSAEANGLQKLAAARSGLKVPAVLGCEDDAEGWAWLALEWLEPSRPNRSGWAELGSGLATLHRTRWSAWGAETPGYIGRLPQTNTPSSDWVRYWWTERLLPQLDRADWPGGRAEWIRLEGALPGLLKAVEEEGPSLLHGDLWSGNVVWSTNGPALVDPASYYGHREVDLSMMELFGGFDPACFEAYREAWPVKAGYEARKYVYQLYYLLVHVNLFGGSYVPRTLATLRHALRHV